MFFFVVCGVCVCYTTYIHSILINTSCAYLMLTLAASDYYYINDVTNANHCLCFTTVVLLVITRLIGFERDCILSFC